MDSLVYQDSIQDLGNHKAALKSSGQGLTPLLDEFTHQPIGEEASVSGEDDATIGQRRGVNESGVHGAPTPAFVVHLVWGEPVAHSQGEHEVLDPLLL